jgi:hypothetical protein
MGIENLRMLGALLYVFAITYCCRKIFLAHADACINVGFVDAAAWKKRKTN